MSNKVIADRLEKERMRINKETVKYNIIDDKIDFNWIFHFKFVIQRQEILNSLSAFSNSNYKLNQNGTQKRRLIETQNSKKVFMSKKFYDELINFLA